ncbi:MAG: damage-control phosphatase ARMT1 family protein [Methermicoccaceae archaeon]
MTAKCIDCLLSRVYYEALLSTSDEEQIMKACTAGLMTMCKVFSPDECSARVATHVHRAVYQALEDEDPYKELKDISNLVAMDVLPLARRFVEEADTERERLKRALLSATIGNAFDFGVKDFEVPYRQFEERFLEYAKQGFAVDDIDEMLNIAKDEDVVYITDNCGEIVFDSLAIRELKEVASHITLVVRGAPIMTDATMEDVVWLGLDKVVDRVLTTGSNAVGVLLDEVPKELFESLNNSSLIIAKGMANYETLSEYNLSPICYLMMAKCTTVAGNVGAKKGELVARLVK